MRGLTGVVMILAGAAAAALPICERASAGDERDPIDTGGYTGDVYYDGVFSYNFQADTSSAGNGILRGTVSCLFSQFDADYPQKGVLTFTTNHGVLHVFGSGFNFTGPGGFPVNGGGEISGRATEFLGGTQAFSNVKDVDLYFHITVPYEAGDELAFVIDEVSGSIDRGETGVE